MADTTSPNKGFLLQQTGNDVNTWGINLNSNFSLIDNNLGGTLALNIAGSSGGTLNLTTNQEQYIFHDLSGTLTGNVIYNFTANGGMFFVFNGTTGAFTVTASITGGGSTVNIPQGSGLWIAVDAGSLNVRAAAGLLPGNNLSDVASTTTSLSNLGGAPLNSPAFTGTPSLPTGATAVTQSAGDASVKIATTQFVSSAITLGETVSQSGGYVNKFRNGQMDIWQRGSGSFNVTTAGAYTADGWIVLPTGATCQVQQTTSNIRTGAQSTYSMAVTGAASITDIQVKQRVESLVAQQLEGQTVTVQAQVYNLTGTSITPTITIRHSGSADNWTSSTVDISTSLQVCPTTTWTRVGYTFTASTASGNGLEAIFDFGNNFNSTTKSIQFTEADIRPTSGLVNGINNSPPIVEFRPISTELSYCQRYLAAFGDIAGAFSANGVAQSTTTCNFGVQLPIPMRVAPTGISITTIADLEAVRTDGVNLAALSTLTLTGTYSSNRMAYLSGTVASGLSAGQPLILSANTALAGNVIFTGAEL